MEQASGLTQPVAPLLHFPVILLALYSLYAFVYRLHPQVVGELQEFWAAIRMGRPGKGKGGQLPLGLQAPREIWTESSSFCRWRNWNTESSNDLPKFIYLVTGTFKARSRSSNLRPHILCWGLQILWLGNISAIISSNYPSRSLHLILKLLSI